ncbi:hypothetical protein E2C01_068276 [Portunus trituberculatus]|uniref:Uncharacterized protein n=1 Tax=Portunus trituberculatus TaxID=210409 RepID=A0A5B7HVD0_PORTR|nr:hypothetical protein [Portunus trituberculatus]
MTHRWLPRLLPPLVATGESAGRRDEKERKRKSWVGQWRLSFRSLVCRGRGAASQNKTKKREAVATHLTTLLSQAAHRQQAQSIPPTTPNQHHYLPAAHPESPNYRPSILCRYPQAQPTCSPHTPSTFSPPPAHQPTTSTSSASYHTSSYPTPASRPLITPRSPPSRSRRVG